MECFDVPKKKLNTGISKSQNIIFVSNKSRLFMLNCNVD